MPVKMPFTGTVLDHLTKPRPDTRFCTGVLRQSYPAVRPPPLPFVPGVTPTTSPAASPTAAVTHAASASVPATAASIPAGAAAAAGSVPAGTLSGHAPVTSSDAAGPAGAPNADSAAQTASPSWDSHADALSHQPAHDGSQRCEPNSSADRASSQTIADTASAATKAAAFTQSQHSVPESTVKQEPASTTSNTTCIPLKSEPATARAAATTVQPNSDPSPATAQAPKQEPTADAHPQQASAAAMPASHVTQQGPGTSSYGVSAPNPATAAARQQQQQQQATTSGANAVPLQAAGQSPVVPAAVGADPWNALDVMWDSDTPPAWPKLVCPWQVGLPSLLLLLL